MSCALITGVNGFVGSHLAELLVNHGWDVHGVLRSFRSDRANIEHLPASALRLHPCDLTDGAAIAAVVEHISPTHVFHLAAQSYVPASWTDPRATLDANVIGTLNVLEAVRRGAPKARVQVAGSSEEYGLVHADECPITEDQPLRPLSPYGVSKVAADVLTRQYAASYNLFAVVTRAFNHSGPRRGHVFAESDWARRIAQIEVGQAPPFIEHGNLDAIRDLTDVRDVVRGYVLALERGTPGGVYNLASGAAQSPSMREVIERLVALSTYRAPIELRPNAARMRPSDVPRLIGDATRARRELGWKPQVKLDALLLGLLNYWRAERAPAPAAA